MSAMSRGAPTRGPNSPREIGVGVRAPRATKPEMASKSKLRQDDVPRNGPRPLGLVSEP